MKTWTFASKSTPGVVYTTRQNDDGSLSCDCRGWTIKKGDAPRSCTHTKSVGAGLGTTPPAAPAVKAAAKVAAPVTVKAAKVAAVPAPMLASAMVAPVNGAAFDRAYAGWFMEQKHDGHRVGVVVAAGTVLAWSRPGRDGVAKARELPEEMKAALLHLGDGTYDGELVSPGGNSWDVTATGSRLVFVAFDVVELEGNATTSLGYEERRDLLIAQLRKLPKGQHSVSTVESLPANWATVAKIWKRGGEGAILKRAGSAYAPGYRSPDWVKVKAQAAAVLTLKGFESGKCGPFAVMQLRDDQGIETTCKTPDNATLAAIAKNPADFLGRRVVISYQQRTPSGKYRHGVFDHFAGRGEEVRP